MKNLLCIAFIGALILVGCAPARHITANKKYSPQQLQKDYSLFRNILEEDHPGLYWYTSKDSMDYYFERGRNQLTDSLTEIGFRNVLRMVLSQIHCGHTTVMPSRAYDRLPDSLRNRPFPLSLKIWKDTAIVAANLNRRDSNLIKGSLITSIDGKPMNAIVDSLFQFLSGDGYNLTHKYQTLSNRGSFGNLYTAVYGYRPRYKVGFRDTLGVDRMEWLRIFMPARDTTKASASSTKSKEPRWKRKKANLISSRTIRQDTALQTAFMDLNTFTKDAHLHRFFKRVFKQFNKDHTPNLVIDLRGNGGGSVTNSNLLTRYLTTKPFKIADSLYAVNRSSRLGKYQQNRFLNWLFLMTMTRKKQDGRYHFRYFEKKMFHPKTKNHFSGQVYILTGGNTFSAATLVAGALKGQSNVMLVGEETGGGAYGNNAWLIPDVTLPVTKVRFRLPLFRLVIDSGAAKGRGVMPEIEVPPTVEAIRQNKDFKMEKVMQLIKEKNAAIH